MEEYPSGQRGQTVNLLALPSMVRIHPPPPARRKRHIACDELFLILSLAHSAAPRFRPQSLRWVAERVYFPVRGCRFSHLRMDETAALSAVPVARCNRRAFPQKSGSILLHHVGASFISLAPMFFTSERAHSAAPPSQNGPAVLGSVLVPPCGRLFCCFLLSPRKPLRWVCAGPPCRPSTPFCIACHMLILLLPSFPAGHHSVPGGFSISPAAAPCRTLSFQKNADRYRTFVLSCE